MVIVGAATCVLGFVVLIFGGVVLILGIALGDERERTLESDGHAVIVGEVAGRAFEIGNSSFEGSFELEVQATAADGRSPVFVGVGPASRVAAYLDGVDHSVDPVFIADGAPRSVGASTGDDRAPAPPGRQSFWDEFASGPGAQAITWPVRGGAWTFVVMRPSGGAGIEADLTTEVRAPFLDWAGGWLGPGLLLVGAVLVLGGLALIAIGLLRPRRPPPPPEMGSPPDVGSSGPSPVSEF